MESALKYKSNRYCSVPQCKSRCTSEVSLFLFPKDGKLEKQWAQALRIGKKISKYMYVCSLHFLREDFILPDIPTKKRRLKKGAIPSQNLPLRSIESKVNVKLAELRAEGLRKRNYNNKFPLNKPKLLSQWLTVLDRKDWTPKPSSRICNRHFSRHDFDNRPNLNSLRLKPDAVPSIFPSLACIPDGDKLKKIPELISIADNVETLDKRPGESSVSGIADITDRVTDARKLRKNLELIVIAVENPEPGNRSKESAKSACADNVSNEDNLRKTPELIEITDPAEISESRKRPRESSVITDTAECVELPPVKVAVIDTKKEVIQPRESLKSEITEEAVPLPIEVMLIDQQRGMQKPKESSENNISDDSELPPMEVTLRNELQQSKESSGSNISIEAVHSPMKILLINEQKKVHQPRESIDCEVTDTTDPVPDKEKLLESSEPIEIAVELPESRMGLRKSSESNVVADTDLVRVNEELRESPEKVVITDDDELPSMKLTIDKQKDVEQPRESSDSDATEDAERVLLESSESDIGGITDHAESPPMKVNLIYKQSSKELASKNVPTLSSDKLPKRDHDYVMASRASTSSRNKSKLKLDGKTTTRKKSHVLPKVDKTPIQKISHVSPKGTPMRMSQRSTKGKCNKMSDFIMFPASASINTVRLTSLIDNKVPEHERKHSTRLRRKVVVMNPTVEEMKTFTKSDKSEQTTGQVTKKADADLFSKITSGCKLVVDLSKNNQCINMREKYLAKTTKVVGKAAVNSGKKKDDPSSRSKESSLKLKDPDKISQLSVTDGPVLSKRGRKLFVDEEHSEIEESSEPTATKGMEKDEEEEAIYNAFVKFIREGGLKEKSAEEKEYDRMALRIVATIKHLKLLNRFNRSSKKLTVLITSLPLVETNETVVVRKKNTMTNEENEIELRVDISSNSRSSVQNRKIHPKNVSEVVSSQKYATSEINPSEYDIIPVTIDVPSDGVRTPEESIPLLVAHVEPNKEVSVNLCHDHNYISEKKSFVTSHEPSPNATYDGQSSKSKKNNFSKSDILFRTRALKKIEDFKSTVKKKNEVIKKLREQIRQLKNEKTFKSKPSKEMLKNRNTLKLVTKSGPGDELSDLASQPADSLDATHISGESNEEEEGLMEEATAGPPLSPIRYICEPAL